MSGAKLKQTKSWKKLATYYDPKKDAQKRIKSVMEFEGLFNFYLVQFFIIYLISLIFIFIFLKKKKKYKCGFEFVLKFD